MKFAIDASDFDGPDDATNSSDGNLLAAATYVVEVLSVDD